MQIKTSICLLWVLLGCFHSWAQQHTLRGTVKDVQGRPLSGVTVSLKGETSSTTLTDAQGQYSLSVKEGNTIIFSALGYRNIERPLGTSTTLDVVMETPQASPHLPPLLRAWRVPMCEDLPLSMEQASPYGWSMV